MRLAVALSRVRLASILVLALLATTRIDAVSAASASDAPAGENHTLTPGDLVLIRVFQEDDLESTLRIGQDGTITFPLVGAVRIGGQSPRAAAETLANALKKGYLRNPQVTVTVTRPFKFRFTVLGQVQKPGAYELPSAEKLSLLQAIGMAGGYTQIADPKKVVVKRRTGEKETIIKLNAKDMAGAGSNSGFEVLAGDVISVGESWF
jgi:polysaccharide export outer membrane protein